MQPTDLTVTAVVEHEGRFLFVEEYASGERVFGQPGGHLEAGESPEQAVVRETLEETACEVVCGELIGVYLWIHPQTRQQFLRIAYAAEFVACDESRELDFGVIGRRWLTPEDVVRRQLRLRSPMVMRCINDYLSGRRQSETLLKDMLPLQQNVGRVIATADLV